MCPCDYVYKPVEERDPLDVLNEERDEAFEQLEQELSAGIARVETDQMTGETKIVGASVVPEGMSDLCILAGLQTRDSLEWQLAAAKAGVQDQNFAVAHGAAHRHGHKH